MVEDLEVPHIRMIYASFAVFMRVLLLRVANIEGLTSCAKLDETKMTRFSIGYSEKEEWNYHETVLCRFDILMPTL